MRVMSVSLTFSLSPPSTPQVVVGDVGLIAVLAGLTFLGYQHGLLWLYNVRPAYVGFLKASLL